MNPYARRRNTTTLEQLETRRLLAAFGTPWPDPRELTISFPADGVDIGSYSNNARETFDQLAERQQWEELALRALQTWAVHADINVGLRNDHDIAFGTPGLTASDPRFGDFRIGAFPQVGLLANSVPFQPAAGTYSGDILLNSNTQFQYHDWAGGLAPDPSALGPGDFDLFSVLLHESGNALGLDDTFDDWTVMFRQYTVPKGVLSQDDIDAIQALYGARTDPYEEMDNGQFSLATLLPTPLGFDPGSDVIRSRGSLIDGNDVDHFQLTPPAGPASVTIRLNTAGISLLKSRLEILDGSGQLIASGSASSVFDNDIKVDISDLQQYPSLYLRVSAIDPSEVYSAGDYTLEIDYRDHAAQSADPSAGQYDAGAESLFTNFSLIEDELGTNDMVSDAETLQPTSFYTGTRFEHQSSLSTQTDIDVWKVSAPAQIDGRLVVHVAGVGLERPELAVNIVDPSGASVGAAGWLRPDGTWALEVGRPQAGQEYLIRISVDPNSAVSVGNYVVTAEFAAPAAQMNDIIAGELDSSMDTFVRWTAGKTRLFRFDLNSTGASPGTFVRLSIYDAHTQHVRLVMDSPADVTRSALVWLTQGDYVLRFTAVSANGDPVSLINYALQGDGVSDDQDDYDLDPEDEEGYDPYEYYYDDYYLDMSSYYEYSPAYEYDYYYLDFDYEYA